MWITEAWPSGSRDHRPRGVRTAAGFTLAEGLIASVVLALAAAALAGGLIAGRQASSVSRQDLTAVGLAQALMNEVASRPFAHPIVDGVTTGHDASDPRDQFLYVGDYDGYTDSTSGLTTQSGQTVSMDGPVYTRSVDVHYEQLSPDAPPAWDCARITVTVTGPDGQVITLNRIITRVIRS